MTITVFPIDGRFASIATSGQHLEYDDVLPKSYPAAMLGAVKGEIVDHLQSTALMNLSTASPEGWPTGHCMHFSTMVDADQRPIIYMFTHDHTRKLENIAANPRVSVSCYRTFGFEMRRKTRAFYGRGVAKRVEDPAEWASAEEAHHTKEGQAYAKLLRIPNQPLLRIDILQAVWFNPEKQPQHGRINYAIEPPDGD